MTRPTRERLKEIREECRLGDCDCRESQEELLAEIDALEVDRSTRQWNTHSRCEELLKERDQLQDRVVELEAQLCQKQNKRKQKESNNRAKKLQIL